MLKVPELAKVAKTMDRGSVQKCGHNMRVGDSSDGGQRGDGLEEAMQGGCEWRPRVDGLLILTLY